MTEMDRIGFKFNGSRASCAEKVAVLEDDGYQLPLLQFAANMGNKQVSVYIRPPVRPERFILMNSPRQFVDYCVRMARMPDWYVVAGIAPPEPPNDQPF